jgi:hypothetical protein
MLLRRMHRSTHNNCWALVLAKVRPDLLLIAPGNAARLNLKKSVSDCAGKPGCCCEVYVFVKFIKDESES